MKKNLLELNKYHNIVEKSPNINYYASKSNTQENKFWVKLINLSDSRCYYCGNSISVDNFHREHRVDKKIFSSYRKQKGIIENSDEDNFIKKIENELETSKYNLIPICSSCNRDKKLSDKNEIIKKLFHFFKSRDTFNNHSQISSILSDENFLESHFSIDILTLSLQGNIKKSEQLKFRQKIIGSIEKLMLKKWQYPDSYIEELLVEKYNQSEENKWYLENVYYMNFAIFY